MHLLKIIATAKVFQNLFTDNLCINVVQLKKCLGAALYTFISISDSFICMLEHTKYLLHILMLVSVCI